MSLANLRWKMETLGYKHWQVAQAAGVSESKLSRALSGRATLGGAQKKRISEFLRCDDLPWLFREFHSVPASYVIICEETQLTPALACAGRES